MRRVVELHITRSHSQQSLRGSSTHEGRSQFASSLIDSTDILNCSRPILSFSWQLSCPFIWTKTINTHVKYFSKKDLIEWSETKIFTFSLRIGLQSNYIHIYTRQRGKWGGVVVCSLRTFLQPKESNSSHWQIICWDSVTWIRQWVFLKSYFWTWGPLFFHHRMPLTLNLYMINTWIATCVGIQRKKQSWVCIDLHFSIHELIDSIAYFFPKCPLNFSIFIILHHLNLRFMKFMNNSKMSTLIYFASRRWGTLKKAPHVE